MRNWHRMLGLQLQLIGPPVGNVQASLPFSLPFYLQALVASSPCSLTCYHSWARAPCQQPQRCTSHSTAGGDNAAGDAAGSNSSGIQAQTRCMSTTSIREELGSGSALGTIAAHGPDTAQQPRDPAERRQSLLAGTGQRFYDTVRVDPHPDGSSSSSGGSHEGSYQLLLHKYPIKTPAKHILMLPTKSLALAVAAEWEWLPTGRPAPHQMPLTGLACTAIDQPKDKAKVVEHLLKYVHTDGACIRYEPGPLERRQQRAFDPLLSWARQELGWQLETTHSIHGTTQSAATVAAVEQYLNGLDPWQLAAIEQLITTSKSLVVSAALLHGRLSVAEAVAAARLEEDFQLEDWGMVEAGHDLDIADTRTRIGAAAVFVRLLTLGGNHAPSVAG